MRTIWRRLARWEPEPDDWRALVRATVVIGLILAFFNVGLEAFFDRRGIRSFSIEFVCWRTMATTIVVVAMIWWMAYDRREVMDRERQLYGMPARPLPEWLPGGILPAAGLVAIAFLVMADRSVDDDSPISFGVEGAIIIGTLITRRRLRRQVLEEPQNRAILDEEWARMHGGPLAGGPA